MNKSNWHRLRTASLSASLLLGAAAVSASGKPSIAAFEYPPIYQDSTKKGLAGEIATAAFKAAGLEVEFRFFSPARMVQAVANGETTCALGGRILFEAPEIAARVTPGPVLHYVLQGLMYDSRKFPQGLGQLSEMNRRAVGVLFSSGIMRFLESRQIRFYSSSTHQASARQLQTGWIDAWAIVDLSGQMHMQQLFPEVAQHFVHTPPFERGDVSLICAQRHDPEQALIRRFEQGLRQIQANGEYLQLMADYYGSPERVPKEVLPDDFTPRPSGHFTKPQNRR